SARLKAEVLAVLDDVPPGRVTTYGTIAEYLGVTARHVARALSSMSEAESEAYPWHRVVAARGVISTVGLGDVGQRQIELLQREGVSITARNTVAGFARLLFTPE